MVVAKNRRVQIVQRTCEVAGLSEKVVEFTRACQEYKRKNSVAQVGNKPEAAFVFSRRKFFAGLGILMAASFLPSSVHPEIFGSPWFSFLQRSNGLHEGPAPADLLYPPVDLSYFETPIGHRL
jgi:hypothetical protein